MYSLQSRQRLALMCVHALRSVQFSSVPWPIGSSRGHDRWFSRDSFPVFSAGGHCEQFWHGEGCPLFDVVHTAFPLPTTVSPTLQHALKDGFGKAVHTMQVSLSWRLPEAVPVGPQGSWFCSMPSCRSCAPCTEVGNAEDFPWAFGFKSVNPFFQSQQAGSMSHSHRGGWTQQESCTAWTCLWSRWCCYTRSCLIWSLLPLQIQSCCRFLPCRCHHCAGLPSGTWNWCLSCSQVTETDQFHDQVVKMLPQNSPNA